MYSLKLITIFIVLSILISTKAFLQNTLKSIKYQNEYKLYDSDLMKNDNIPKCEDCKWFSKNIKETDSIYGLCKMFGTKSDNNKKLYLYEYAIHVRNNKSQCGKEGFLFQDKIIDSNLKFNYEEIKSLNKYMKKYSKHNMTNKNKKFN